MILLEWIVCSKLKKVEKKANLRASMIVDLVLMEIVKSKLIAKYLLKNKTIKKFKNALNNFETYFVLPLVKLDRFRKNILLLLTVYDIFKLWFFSSYSIY